MQNTSIQQLSLCPEEIYKSATTQLELGPCTESDALRNHWGRQQFKTVKRLKKSSRLLGRTNDSAEAYAKVCTSVAAESGHPVHDLWTNMEQISGWEKTPYRFGFIFLCRCQFYS